VNEAAQGGCFRAFHFCEVLSSRKILSSELADIAIVRLLEGDSHARSSMNPESLFAWGADWAWGLPLIVVTVVFHAYSLGVIDREVTTKLNGGEGSRHVSSLGNFLIGGTALAATVLHAIEVAAWACAYRLLGASANNKSAMLYSLNAITSYGHANLDLEPRWQMMGALEALNGWILFGLTTAFLFTVIQKVWPQTKGTRSPGAVAS
jgi:hypothetical protein